MAALAGRPTGGWLAPDAAERLATAVGIPLCPAVCVRSADEAAAAADRLGYPVALKTAAAVVHKTELGGVRVGLRDAGEVRSAYPGVAAAGADPMAGVLVQPVVRPGTELLVGVSRTEPYPPLVLVGLGGTAAELLADTAVRLAPLTDVDAREAVRELRPRRCSWATAARPRWMSRRSKTCCCGSARWPTKFRNWSSSTSTPSWCARTDSWPSTSRHVSVRWHRTRICFATHCCAGFAEGARPVHLGSYDPAFAGTRRAMLTA